jgi:hypothetical protein
MHAIKQKVASMQPCISQPFPIRCCSREHVATPPPGALAAVDGFLRLTAPHRRRRSLYYMLSDSSADAVLAAEQEPSSLQITPGSIHELGASTSAVRGPGTLAIPPGLPASLAHQRLTMQRVSRPEVLAWIERELQALMLQSDVALVAQHVLGTLKYAAAQRLDRQHMHGVGVAEAAALLRDAAKPYIPQHAARFAWEVVAFVHSGLGVKAHDARTFGAGTAAREASWGEEEALALPGERCGIGAAPQADASRSDSPSHTSSSAGGSARTEDAGSGAHRAAACAWLPAPPHACITPLIHMHFTALMRLVCSCRRPVRQWGLLGGSYVSGRAREEEGRSWPSHS